MASRQDDRIRERAYHLWQESGGEPGREMEHWLKAEREVADAKEGSTAARAAPKAVPDLKKSEAKPAAAKPAATKSTAAKPAAGKPAAGKPAAGEAAGKTAGTPKPGLPKQAAGTVKKPSPPRAPKSPA